MTDLGSVLAPGQSCDGRLDEERTELSYVSYEDQYYVDRSLPPSDEPGSNGTSPRGPRSPYVAISSQERSLYLPYRRGTGVLDEPSGGALNAVDISQHLSSPNIRSNLSTGESPRVSNPPIDIESQAQHPSANAVDSVLSEVSEDVKNPLLAADPHSQAGVECVATSTPTHTTNNTPQIHDTTAPIRNPNGPCEGATSSQADIRAPPAPPLRLVRTRGAFIIGNGAPIKIDESIEIHLIDCADGRVDFVI